MRRLSTLLFLVCAVLVPLSSAHHIKKAATQTMPLTTASPKARDLYERAMQDYENLYLERANIGWRAAVEADPDCALAHAWIAFNGRDPAESKAAREKAKALEAKITPGERLMVEWIYSVQENNFIAGISAMNDMLEMYPKDKRLLYLVGNWLMLENENGPAGKMFERSLAIDKNYPAALNDLAYVYARNREFDKAFSAMERYIVLLPKEPNPHDSYGELLRMAGRFDQSLEEYRKALKIDPDFVTSQLGLADTHALAGDQAQARIDYDLAIRDAHNEADRLDYSLQKAATWVREGNFEEADKAYGELARTAKLKGLDLEVAQAHRMMALYQPKDETALKHLKEAEDALTGQVNIAQLSREEERSRILRYRACRAAHGADLSLAEKTVQELEKMANSSRSAVVQTSYHAAAGAVLISKQKYAEAIPNLEDDEDNPFSLEMLSQAYKETGAGDQMHEVEARLRGTNVATLEQALVVPAARSKRPDVP